MHNLSSKKIQWHFLLPLLYENRKSLNYKACYNKMERKFVINFGYYFESPEWVELKIYQIFKFIGFIDNNIQINNFFKEPYLDGTTRAITQQYSVMKYIQKGKFSIKNNNCHFILLSLSSNLRNTLKIVFNAKKIST